MALLRTFPLRSPPATMAVTLSGHRRRLLCCPYIPSPLHHQERQKNCAVMHDCAEKWGRGIKKITLSNVNYNFKKLKTLATCKSIIKTPQVCQEFSLLCLLTVNTNQHFPVTSPFLIRPLGFLTAGASFAAVTSLDAGCNTRWEGKWFDHSLIFPGLQHATACRWHIQGIKDLGALQMLPGIVCSTSDNKCYWLDAKKINVSLQKQIMPSSSTMPSNQAPKHCSFHRSSLWLTVSHT